MSYTINPAAIQLGACKVWYDDSEGWMSIGATYGGTKVEYAPTYFDLKIDQLGDTVVKKILKGESASISFGIAESGLSKLQLAMPFGTLYSSGGDQALGVGVNAGGDLLDKTVALKVHPINSRGSSGTDDESYIDDDFIFWKTGNAQAVEIDYSPDSPRVYKVKLSVFPDTTKGAGKYLFVIGDPATAGLDTTPPTIASATVEVSNAETAIAGATNVDTDTPVRLTFSEDVLQTTVIPTNVLLKKDGATSFVAGTLSYTAATHIVTFVPLSPLDTASDYELIVTGIKDIAGNRIVAAYAARFTTHS